MMLKLRFKTPYAVMDAINEAFDYAKDDERLDEDEEDELRHQLEELCAEFVSWGEFVTIEIDSEKRTATVVRSDS